jgi:putative Ca2+/H+ antiporter (TMEM165/GDT1 family)
VHVATVVATFATVFLAELPDKTMLATVVLSARFRRPLAVWLGAATALTVQAVVAVTAGQLLSLLPDRPVRIAVAGLFAVGAVVLWRGHHGDADIGDEIDDLPRDATARPLLARRQVAATAFGIVFIAEWGDLTQLATASLAASRPPFSVLLGAALALISVSTIGVLAGRALLRVLPERLLHRAAALVFAALAVLFLVAAIRDVDIDTRVSTLGSPMSPIGSAS